MDIELYFKATDGTPITECTIHADTPEEASEVIAHVLLEVYAKYGPGVSITPLPTIT